MAKLNPLVILPPVLFAGLAAFFYFGLNRDNPDELPSVLVEKQAPALNVTQLRDDAPPTDADLRSGDIKLVNFWASWCAPCRAEHPILEEMAGAGIPIFGINYKDKPENALGFLAEIGDPFAKIGADANGRNGIEWGLYGVPETFVLDADGTILLRHPGPITRAVLQEKILPAIASAQ